jgi:Antp family protein
MDMSSYQFVNTLAQCYEQAGVGGGGGVPGVAATPHEYYGMQYPACYSPATQAYSHQYATMMAASGGPNPAQQQQQQPDYGSPPSAATSATAVSSLSHRRSPVVGGVGLAGLGPAQPAGIPSSGGGGSLGNIAAGGGTTTTAGGGGVIGSVLPQPNCKYADSNVGSPQDLSTNSSGGTPQPGGGPHGGGGLGGPKSPESDLEDDEEPSSPLSPSPGASGSSSATKKEGGDSKSNPPQIYPWMKRVHLGQSKSISAIRFKII